MQRIESSRGVLVSLFRIVVGLLFACHGVATLFGVLGGAHGSGRSAPVGAWPGWWAALIELVAGGLVVLGLFTRPAAVLASGTMAYAYFTVHQAMGLLPMQNGGELAALYCWSFLAVAVIGPGSLALDAVLPKIFGSRAQESSAQKASTPKPDAVTTPVPDAVG